MLGEHRDRKRAMQSINPKPSRKDSRRSRGPRRSPESHEAILDAAEALLNEGGPSALTFEAVARRARAGKPTLYRWWPNKTTLLLELCTRRKSGLVEMPDLGSLRADLVAYTRALWRFWQQDNHGSAFAALIAEAQQSPEGQAVLAQAYLDREDGPSLPAFERARARGELAPDAAIPALRRAYVANNWLHLLCGRLDEKAVESTIDILLDGILARPPADEV